LFATSDLPERFDAIAPDGSEVRLLLALDRGSLAHFSLAVGECSVPVRHRTVEEIWFVLGGRGEIWRSDDRDNDVTALAPGTCISIPVATSFQFRSAGPEALVAVAVTMPPWSGDGEAVRVSGPWTPTVAPGPGLGVDAGAAEE
jgi:mannose-6-phosphate isomerase-like protein (cupin superfamily)